jgi:hypothetical protein
MQGAATQAISMHIVEERQRSRCPPAAAPFRAAARRPAGFVARSLHTAEGMLVARASPAGLGASSKVGLLFRDRSLEVLLFVDALVHFREESATASSRIEPKNSWFAGLKSVPKRSLGISISCESSIFSA